METDQLDKECLELCERLEALVQQWETLADDDKEADGEYVSDGR